MSFLFAVATPTHRQTLTIDDKWRVAGWRRCFVRAVLVPRCWWWWWVIVVLGGDDHDDGVNGEVDVDIDADGGRFELWPGADGSITIDAEEKGSNFVPAPARLLIVVVVVVGCCCCAEPKPVPSNDQFRATLQPRHPRHLSL